MYLVAGQRHEAGKHELERALAAAHDARIRPLCLCSKPPIPVYITRLGETFVLKRMPLTGSQHAVGCSHYEPPPELSGLSEVLGTAISEDPDTGDTELRVGFSLSKAAPRAVMSSTGQEKGRVRSDGTRLSLRGLLHYLWHEAELTRWHPGFAGKRSWGVVRRHLLAAAMNKTVHGVPLADLLYVPEDFTVANRDEIRSRRMRRCVHGLRRHGDTRSLMLLIGEIKEIVPARCHFKAVIKHVPDQALFLSSQIHRRMTRHFEKELLLWGASEMTRMIGIATFDLSDMGLPMIEELSLMPTTRQWLPVDDGHELQLIDRLVNDGRRFEKTLRFNAKGGSRSASAILLDARQSPIAMCLDRADAECDDDSEMEASTGAGLRQWLWRVHASELPALPT